MAVGAVAVAVAEAEPEALDVVERAAWPGLGDNGATEEDAKIDPEPLAGWRAECDPTAEDAAALSGIAVPLSAHVPLSPWLLARGSTARIGADA